ncbi:MAG: PEP-CTERM sorting domain-containing protein [Planctomycetota bacterium]|nr:PEP-CTERM sorting domain-containing protein [Planctomycetota bacterium]
MGVAANAAVNLPTAAAPAVRFDGGPMVFDTFSDPLYDEASGQVGFAGPVVLAAFGDLVNIVNANASIPGPADRGSPAVGSQLTYVFAGELANIEIDAKASNALSTTKKSFNISGDIVGIGGRGAALLALFDKSTGVGLDTQGLIGQNHSSVPFDPASVLSVANDGGAAPVYLDFSSITSGTAHLEVTFEKVGGSSTFNKRTITVQIFGAENFPVTGGTAASLFTGGIGFTGNQHLKLIDQVASGSSVGENNTWVEGNFALTVARVVPEPASLAMVGLGALLIGARRRNRVQA